MGHRWIDNEDGLEELLEAAQGADPLFVDTEFMRERTFWPELALVQINTGSLIFLVDAPALGASDRLRGLMQGRRTVMHACSEDLEAIRAFGGALPDDVADTQIAAALCGASLQCSYQRLVSEQLDVDLPKDVTRSNWLQRPLSEKQRTYAEKDVVYLPQLHERLRERLEALGRLEWWREECARLREGAQAEMAPEQAWRQVKGAGSLRGEALARLARLAAWREETARRRNLPRGFVVRDPELLELAREGAGSLEDLRRLQFHPALVRRDGQTVLDLLREAGGSEPPEALPDQPGPEERALMKRLRARVREQADSLGLEPEVLMRRRWLEALIRDPEVIPEPLSGWRRELVAEPLREMLS